MAQTVVPWIPLWAYDAWVARGVDWLAMSEDLPSAGQPRHASTPDGRIRLHVPAEQRARRTGSSWRRRSASCGGWASGSSSRTRTGARTRRTSAARSCFGTDPRASVLDPFCRAHDVENLFVVDASFFPSSAAVNPGSDDRGAGAAGRRSHRRLTRPSDGAPTESAIVQPRRHHRVGLQPGGAVLLGRLRLPARRRGGHAARTRARVLRRRRAGRRRCRIGWIRVPGGGDRSRSSSSSRSCRPSRSAGTASA